MRSKNKERLSQEDIKARLMFLIGAVLSFVFLIVTLGITYALIFVTQPIGNQAPNDAAFIDLPAQVENNQGTVFAGPGSRVMTDILMGQRQDIFSDRIIIREPLICRICS